MKGKTPSEPGLVADSLDIPTLRERKKKKKLSFIEINSLNIHNYCSEQ